nr:hypothetical protein [Tanacetum cinerariifolium]
MPPKPNIILHDAPTVNETIPTAFNVELSPTKPDKDLSQSNRPSAPIIEDWVSDSENKYEGKPMSTQKAPSFVQPTKHVKNPRSSIKTVEHLIPADHLRKDFPKSKGHSNYRNKKACFVCKSLTYLIKDCDYYEKKMVQTPARNHAQRGNHQHYARMTHHNPYRHVVPTTVLTRSKLVPLTAARPVTTAVPHYNVTRPRPSKTIAPKVNVVKGVQGNWGNPQHDLKDKEVIDSGCSRHITGNMSYLTDFEEINGGYVAFSENPKGGKITSKDTECIVLSSEFKLPDKNQVLLRVPRENNMYNMDLKNIVPSGDLTCLFAKATLVESNLWHRRLDPLGKFNRKADEGFLVGYSNTDDDATFKVKEPEFEVEKLESEVHVSPSSSAKTKKHDDKTKREAKGKILVDTPVPAVGQISTNSTNTFSAASPSNIAVSPTLERSSYVDPSQYPYDLNMPYLEDITYSDDEEDVGAEADFSNLETTITASHIPTTRVHKVHPVTQIIGDLSIATQTKSMTRMVKDQGGLTQINNEDFHTCKFACFLSQEDPKEYTKHLKIQVRLKLCRRSFFNLRCKRFGSGFAKRNKAQLVAQGHTQEEDIDYEEVFTPGTRIEAFRRLFLAYDSFMGFMVYQMDVKSAFLYGTIEEEVYVYQPSGFEDTDYPDKKGKIDQTLFIKKQKGDILLVQVYLDDIIFGLQVKQKQDGIFISQDKYVAEILRKFGLTDRKSASTTIDTEKTLLKDPNGEDMDSSVSVKKTNDVIRSQALIERKKVIITEDTVRQAIRLDDAESVDCLPNEEIFTKLARIGTTWNEFSSSMASAVICLATGRKFNFLKYIFNSLVRNVDSSSKFYMYPRFLHLIIRAQVGDLSSHTTKYSSLALTQKVFANMRMVGKGFSRVETPLFEGMLVPQQAADDVSNLAVDDVNDVVAEADVSPTLPPSPIAPPSSPLQQPQPSKPTTISMELLNTLLETCTALTRRVENLEQDKIAQALEITKLKQRVKRLEKRNKVKALRRVIADLNAYKDVTLEEFDAAKDAEVEKNADVHRRLEESQAKVYHIDLEHADKVLSMQDDEPEPGELKEVIEVVTTAKLMTEVVTAATTPITAATITAGPSAGRRRKGVVIRDPEETATPSTMVHSEPKAKDKRKGILVEDPKLIKKQAQIEQDEDYARELEAKLNKNINWDDVIEQVKEKGKQDNAVLRHQALKRKPQTEAQARKNMMVYLKNIVGFKMDYFKGMTYDDIRLIFEKYFNSNVAFLEKSKEQLRQSESSEQQAPKKQKLDEEVPVVDYEIHTENNKPYYKIIRADGSHQLFLSFLSLLRNFDREDLEMLWQIVQERFASSKPKNFLDDFLLCTLKAMFEKPDVEAQTLSSQIKFSLSGFGSYPRLLTPYSSLRDKDLQESKDPQFHRRVLYQSFKQSLTKIQEVLHATDDNYGPTYDAEPLEKVQRDDEYIVFADEHEHIDQPENMTGTSLMEKVDRNTIPDSSYMCNNEFENDYNANDYEHEPVMPTNLIVNLKLDTDETTSL